MWGTEMAYGYKWQRGAVVENGTRKEEVMCSNAVNREVSKNHEKNSHGLELEGGWAVRMLSAVKSPKIMKK